MMMKTIGHSRVAWFEDVLEVMWDDRSVSHLPYLWLRDNCGCHKCRVPQTKEKRILLNRVPVSLRPVDGQLEGDELLLSWPDGHQTRYSGSAIRALEAQHDASWTPWGARFRPPQFDYRQFLDDDATAIAAFTAFLRFGAIILNDAGSRPGTVETLSTRLGPLREMPFGRVHDVQVDPAGYNISHTALELPPHNDFASTSTPPSVQALHMLINEVSGGETVIVDGWRIAAALRKEHPEYFASLCTMPVPFRMADDIVETHAAAPLIKLDADGRIAAFRFSNHLMQTIAPNRTGLAAFYRAYHELCRRVTNRSSKAGFRLQVGQVLVLAAHRVLHGRRAIRPDGRRRLQDTYFEHDNVRNHLFVLNRRLAAFAGGES